MPNFPAKIMKAYKSYVKVIFLFVLKSVLIFETFGSGPYVGNGFSRRR